LVLSFSSDFGFYRDKKVVGVFVRFRAYFNYHAINYHTHFER
jgi:hypothetical protein